MISIFYKMGLLYKLGIRGCRSFLAILFFLGVGINITETHAQTALLSDLDIPLMQGFQEDENSRVVFDTPEGRIIEARAEGMDDAKQVFEYYQIVLPSLGWRVQNIQTKAQSPKPDVSPRMPDNLLPREGCMVLSAYCIMARRDTEVLTLKIKDRTVPKGKTIIYFSVNPE